MVSIFLYEKNSFNSMCVLVTELGPTLCDPMVASQAPLSMGVLLARILEWGACPSSGYLPDSGIQPGSPSLQADALPSELLEETIHSIQTGKIVLTDK